MSKDSVEDGITSQMKEVQISENEDQHNLFSNRDLYGGAIRMNLPSKWRDLSMIRQGVPDNVECFQDCTFQDGSRKMLEGTGACIIVEILGRQDDVKDEDAASFFFKDLAEANGGELGDLDYSSVQCVGAQKKNTAKNGINMPSMARTVCVCSCIGDQSIAPLKNRTELEPGKADSVKVELCVIRLEKEETDILISLSMPHPSETYTSHSKLFLDILKGFQIVDWSLFG